MTLDKGNNFQASFFQSSPADLFKSCLNQLRKISGLAIQVARNISGDVYRDDASPKDGSEAMHDKVTNTSPRMGDEWKREREREREREPCC
jgi:hypothetical protein